MTQYKGNLDIVKESEGRRRKTKQKRRGGSSIVQRKQEERTTNKPQLFPYQPMYRMEV